MDESTFMKHMEDRERTLYRACCALLSGEADRRDAMQETALRAWQSRGRLREEKYFATWCTRILVNVCHDMGRRTKNYVLAEDPAAEEIAPQEDPELRLLLESLQEKLRLPLVLYYMEGFSIADVARTLGVPQGTVKYRLHQARKALKVELEQDEEVQRV